MRSKLPLARMAAALVVISVTPQAAWADKRDGDWYGWQTMAVDTVSVGTFALGINLHSNPAALAGAGGLLLGAPILHAAHGNWGNAGLSLGSRVLLPIGGLALGALFRNGKQGRVADAFDALGSSLLGGLFGAGAALVVDYAVISYDDAPASNATPQARQWMLSLSAPL